MSKGQWKLINPNNNKNKNKIDVYLAFRRKAKTTYQEVQNGPSDLFLPPCLYLSFDLTATIEMNSSAFNSALPHCKSPQTEVQW